MVLGLGLKLNSGETDCSYQVDSTSSAVFSMYQADAKEMRGGRWAYPRYARGTSYYPSAQTRTPISSAITLAERVRETPAPPISPGYPGKQALHYNGLPIARSKSNGPKELAMRSLPPARIASFRAAAECHCTADLVEEHPAVIITACHVSAASGAKWCQPPVQRPATSQKSRRLIRVPPYCFSACDKLFI